MSVCASLSADGDVRHGGSRQIAVRFGTQYTSDLSTVNTPRRTVVRPVEVRRQRKINEKGKKKSSRSFLRVHNAIRIRVTLWSDFIFLCPWPRSDRFVWPVGGSCLYSYTHTRTHVIKYFDDDKFLQKKVQYYGQTRKTNNVIIVRYAQCVFVCFYKHVYTVFNLVL